jgi:hypothetical protein
MHQVVSEPSFCLQTADKRRTVEGYSLIPSSGIRAEILLVDNKQRRGDKRTRSCTLCVTFSQLRAMARLGGRAKIEVPMYEGNLDAGELLDWIRSMDKYFDYEDVDEEGRVRHVVTRLKGHAVLWWDELHVERRSKGKQNIMSWDIMVAKLKAKFMPKDFQINLFRKMQNLR